MEELLHLEIGRCGCVVRTGAAADEELDEERGEAGVDPESVAERREPDRVADGHGVIEEGSPTMYDGPCWPYDLSFSPFGMSEVREEGKRQVGSVTWGKTWIRVLRTAGGGHCGKTRKDVEGRHRMPPCTDINRLGLET